VPVIAVDCSTAEADPFHGTDADSLASCAKTNRLDRRHRRRRPGQLPGSVPRLHARPARWQRAQRARRGCLGRRRWRVPQP
jgi:hypothetical protein